MQNIFGSRAGRGGALLAIGIPLVWYGMAWNPTGKHDVLIRSPRYLAALPLTQNAGRVYLPAHDLFWKRYITAGYNDYGTFDARHIQTLVDTILPNIGVADGVRSASGYEPVPVSAQSALDGAGRQALRRGEPNLSRLMTLMDARLLGMPGALSVHDPRLRSLRVEARPYVAFWKNDDALASAWLVHRVKRVEGAMRITAALTSPEFQPGREALVCDAAQPEDLDLQWPSTTIQSNPDERSSKRDLPVTLTSEKPTQSIYVVQYVSKPAMLIVAQTAYPGWKARVDGAPAALHRVDATLMGVYLSPGSHRVQLMYQPESYRIGLFLSLLACGVFSAGWGIVRGLRRMLPRARPCQRVELRDIPRSTRANRLTRTL